MYQVRPGLGSIFTLTPGTIEHCASGWYWADPFCWATGNSQSDFQRLALPGVATPGVPTQAQLQGPADQAVSELVDEQMRAQQALNAQQVDSSVTDRVLGAAGAGVTAVEDAAGAVASAFPWLLVGGLAAGVFVLSALANRGRR